MREQRRAKARFRLAHLPAAFVISALGCSLLAPNDDELFDTADDGGLDSGSEGGTAGSSGGRGGVDPSGSGGMSTPGGGDASVGGTGDPSSAGASGGMSEAGAPGMGQGGARDDGGAGGESGSGIVAPTGGTSGAPTGGTGGALTGCAAPAPACMANAKGMEEKACGNCGKSTRTRTCNADCTWGAWSDWSACGGQGECAPNATGTMSDRCPSACGPRTLTRTCSNSCTWGAWTVTASTCVACTACAELVYCDAPGERGTWCKQSNRACTDSEINAECAAILRRVDCVRVEPYYLEHL